MRHRNFNRLGQGLRAFLFIVPAIPLLLCGAPLLGQSPRSTSPDVGVRNLPPSDILLENAVIHVTSDLTIEAGKLLIRDGRIAAVSSGAMDAPGAKVVDCKGDHLYPGFIDAFVEFDASTQADLTAHWNAQVKPERKMAEQQESDEKKLAELRKNGFGICLIAPSSGIIKGQSCLMSTADQPLNSTLIRDSVFQHLRAYPSRGQRGAYPNSPMGAVALIRQTLSDASWYAKSHQTAAASGDVNPPEFNSALEALQPVLNGTMQVVMDGSNELYAMRADRIAREFALKLVIRGSGREYRRLDSIVKTRRPIIVPIDFPKAPEVETQQQIANTTLQELMHWNLAPENPKMLADAGVDFVITSEGSGSDFLKNLRKSVERGLTQQAAIDAITMEAAALLGIDEIAGSLEVGKLANIVRLDGDLFASKSKVVGTWVDGQLDEYVPSDELETKGTWELQIADAGDLNTLFMTLAGTSKKPKGEMSLTLKTDDDKGKDDDEGDEPRDVDSDSDPDEDDSETDAAATDEEEAADEDKAETDEQQPDSDDDAKKKSNQLKNLEITKYRITASFASKGCVDQDGQAFLSAAISKTDSGSKLIGSIQWPNGEFSDIDGKLLQEDKDEPDASEASDVEEVLSPSDRLAQSTAKEESESESKSELEQKSEPFRCEVNYPLGAYGVTEAPEQYESLVLRNATIWTSAEAGILESADLLIANGLIEAVGANLEVPSGTVEIDATGTHISPGIIDCHSHMATDGGVNESGQAITAEVRIGDFIDPNDITIYRQLAGGVTTSNILHGSANPIGGQNQVIKLRWGSLGETMKMHEAPSGIKFALGENVKQSNRDSEYRTRYPQTRMGVEQIMRDRFEAAKLYRAKQKSWTLSPSGLPPRRDYELDAIAEILEGTRWIHCHSYRQDEILTVLRTLDDYGVTIGSLQHILEGYKVADAMAKHGATGSSFSDWWAYKFEVYDAIPYNGALMHNAGIVVSFNSDDRELARHLNHEAAKAVKYGGVPEGEALKFVTLNPAKQLRIDQWVGSLEPGKHADFVVWNRSPLSTFSACQQTWVDGRKYFDREEDQKRRDVDAQLHRKLVRLIVDGKEETGPKSDKDPSFWWARHDEFCHDTHEDDHDDH